MSDRGTVDTIMPLGGAPRMTGRKATSNSIADFASDLENDALKGLWLVEGRVDAASEIRTHVWKAEMLRANLDRAGELMRLSNSPVRRALLLWNPGARDHWDVTNTLTASVQMMRPGETVTAHRHIHSTMMYITQGKGAYTIVNGEKITISAGDLVLAPNWYWHEHGNLSDTDIVWMTGLDRSLVKLFDSIFFEGFPSKHQDVTAVDDGVAPRTSVRQADPRFSSKLVWRSDEIMKALADKEKLGDFDPHDDVIVEFRDPASGRSVTPTFGCAIQKLRPGVHTHAHRHTTSAVYHVVRGHGHTIVEGKRYDWSEGDYLALPHRAWHEHVNSSSAEPAVLFSLTDKPAFEALALLREEPLNRDGTTYQALS